MGGLFYTIKFTYINICQKSYIFSSVLLMEINKMICFLVNLKHFIEISTLILSAV